ncbi:hypothetical protein ACQ4OB_17475 [Pseudomonas sp. ES4]|uniref:hypothetical protein n=1 Tax=Pseudomonas sp. ES4 TaxID=3424777 RepID=UPI003D351AF3
MGYFEIVLSVSSVLLGFGLSSAYAWLKNLKKAKYISVVMLREIRLNIRSLEEELSVADSYLGGALPRCVESLGLVEIAGRLDDSIFRESFDSCRFDIPLLGLVSAEAVFVFYESAQTQPKSLREIERWAGNIRHGLIKDIIGELISKAKSAEQAILR